MHYDNLPEGNKLLAGLIAYVGPLLVLIVFLCFPVAGLVLAGVLWFLFKVITDTVDSDRGSSE